ncbi:transferase [Trypanosoma rangeli]|uniref:Transferase n=1 Tax=Trypanosoma rangeli TaxID=5698 RepID=A0A3R7KBV7_TRYRA|nr:transferase [Trypanosoma rangeli]RNF05021.1 transferase [Trypanosoma rangeli]|eukprot:RNF05021.1 transferase [Trypanosoma rangeli]
MRGTTSSGDEDAEVSPPDVPKTATPLHSSRWPTFPRSVMAAPSSGMDGSSSSNSIFGVNDQQPCPVEVEVKEYEKGEPMRGRVVSSKTSDCRTTRLSSDVINFWWERRYKALFPLNWGMWSKPYIVLARDVVDGRLVTTRRYLCRRATNASLLKCLENGDFVNASFIPFTASWKRRMHALLNLRHTNVNPVTDILMDEERQELLLVHPYVDGMQPLASVFHHQPHLMHRELTPSLLLRILRNVVDGLLFLHHHGIIHGAISPWTILLDAKGLALVTGFGVEELCMYPLDENPTGGSMQPFYVAPEVKHPLSRFRLATVASDAFSVGALTFALTQEKQDGGAYILLRQAMVGLMQSDPQHRMTLHELSLLLTELESQNTLTETVSQELRRRMAAAPASAEGPALFSREERASPSSPCTASVMVFLRRDSSPLLHRDTGLKKWRSATMTTRMMTHKEQRRHRRVCQVLFRWRVVAVAVLFCVIVARKGRKRQQALAARLLSSARQAQLKKMRCMSCGGSPLASVSTTPLPRRPTMLEKRRSR